MLFKRKVITVEAEQFLPKDGDTTFTLFGQECKVIASKGIKYCCFIDADLDEELFIEQGQYLMQEDGDWKVVLEGYIYLYFEPVKE